MTRSKKLVIGGIVILIGGALMRISWIFIYEQLSVVFILTGAGLFIGGVIYFTNALFQNRRP